jgi:hypothetical protein
VGARLQHLGLPAYRRHQPRVLLDLNPADMPTESTYPKLDIPDVDLWTFLFERKDREYPDDKGTIAPFEFEN